jgi:hypothetical protein
MKYFNFFIVVFFLITASYFTSCTDKLPEPSLCNTVDINYNTHIDSILNSNCELSGCHDGSSQIDFGTYSSLGAARMNVIYQKVVIDNSMPPSGNISTSTVDSIRCWKESGFLEN